MKSTKKNFVRKIKPSTTILVIDIRGFTAIANETLADEIAAFIDEFFEIVADALVGFVVPKKRQVEINKFLGDGFLIFFFDNNQGPSNAIDAAFRIKKSFNSLKNGYGFGNLDIASAVHKGDIIYGLFGSLSFSDKSISLKPKGLAKEFTGIGTPINMTFRLLNEAQKNEVLVTTDICDHIPMKRYIVAIMNPLELKGLKHDLVVPRWLFREKTNYEINNKIIMECGDGCERYNKICKKSWEAGKENRIVVHGKVVKTKGDQECCSFCPKFETCEEKWILKETRKSSTCCPICPYFSTCSFNWHRGKYFSPMVCCLECRHFSEIEMCNRQMTGECKKVL